MENQIVVIQNVRGYCDEQGTAWLNAEDVARGLGFTEEKNGVEYVKWRRVNEYLQGFGFSPQVAKDDFIPENMFYRLAMKANNEVAEVFQAKIADEILPAIRKTGSYSLKKEEALPPTAAVVYDIRKTVEQIQKLVAVKEGIAISHAIDLVGAIQRLPIEGLKQIIPPAEHETGYLNATRIGEKLGGIKPQFVNRLLTKGGFLYKDGKNWRLTDKGKEFGEEMPYTRNGHSGYQIRWHESIVAQVRAVLAQAA